MIPNSDHIIQFGMNAAATILITGGAGFIGSRYVRRLVKDHPKWSIRVLDLLTYSGSLSNLAGLEGQIQFIRGDIADPEAARDAVSGCGLVVNCAAESHVDRSLVDGAPFERTNIEGVRVLLEAAVAAGVDRFLQVSTDEVYGDLAPTAAPSVEGNPLRPTSPYAISKAAGDAMVLAAHAEYGLETVLTRGANTFGPHQYPEKIIPLFITNAMLGYSIPVYGDGSAVRDYIHVDDHCRGLSLALEHGVAGGTYNLGGGLRVSALEIAESIVTAVNDDKSMIRFVRDRPGHDMRYCMDSSFAKSIGWQPSADFQSQLHDTIDWYVNNRSWWEPIRNTSTFKQWMTSWYDDRS